MSEESLLTAARRVVRFLNIDLNKGGIVTIDTQMALHTLEQQIVKLQKKEEQDKFLEEEKAK